VFEAWLEAWLADLQVDEAVDARARVGWLRRQADEEATFVGVLADLAERKAPVVIESAAGARVGRLRVIGQDFCALQIGEGPVGRGHVLVPYRSLASVRPSAEASTAVVVTGDRLLTPRATFIGALSALADERARLRLTTPAGALTGELRSVGVDVATLRLDDRRPAYARVTSLVEVSVVESG
jgi:hypothetical protein